MAFMLLVETWQRELDYYHLKELRPVDWTDDDFGEGLGCSEVGETPIQVLETRMDVNNMSYNNTTHNNMSYNNTSYNNPSHNNTSFNSSSSVLEVAEDEYEEAPGDLFFWGDYSSLHSASSNVAAPPGSFALSGVPSDSDHLPNSTISFLHSFPSNNVTVGLLGYLDDTEAGLIDNVATCIIIIISLPLILIAIHSLYSLVRSDHVAPIYVINLLTSDLIQLCCMICEVARPRSPMIFIINKCIHNYSLMTSVVFMVCIALERYLLIVFPLWYHCRQTIRSTVVICALAWVLPSLYLFTLFFGGNFNVPQMIAVVFLLLPLPLLLFFCCATLRALSASVSILPDEKRRIVGTLVVVLLIYMLLFLPNVILILVARYTKDQSLVATLVYVSAVFLKLNPLADLVLYIFTKKGFLDKILASVRCCRVEDRGLSSLETTLTV
ncbi:mas-related G-protein coupled receptor member X3-like [Etheostoma spectabile]|uniref:mas-related G-protein coupled receptor member X3-like n=1 Tax=Etheostoma spectabile TaxID=54343 RepID=UPI0013AE9D44|nr:mas-related G-protein coupled receptor member X3-like [Etheostoma spectabile]